MAQAQVDGNLHAAGNQFKKTEGGFKGRMTSALIGRAIQYLFFVLDIILTCEVVRVPLVSSLRGSYE
jgi:hypothetical protein